jgi:hypothetical protein
MSGLHIDRQRNFHVVRWLLALLLFAVVCAYGYFGLRWYHTGELSPLPIPVAAADNSIDESDIDEINIEKHTVAANEPRYLEIPKLGLISTRVMKTDMNERKMLNTPANLNDVGWFSKSATPGSGVGALIINGHAQGATKDGALDGVSSLTKGDQILIERGDGELFIYEVVDTQTMPVADFIATGMKAMMVSVDPEKEGLNLIVSSGSWVPKQKLYNQRLLVRATIVE